MEGAFKLISGCFKPVANSHVFPISSSVASPKESCKENDKNKEKGVKKSYKENEKKKEKGVKSNKGSKAPIPISYFPLGSNLSRL